MAQKDKQRARDYSKKRYSENKSVYITRATSYAVGVRKRNKQYVIEYLKTHPCIDCGETDPVVLDFDHVRGKKVGNISIGVRSWSLEKLKIEIDKCEVRCANDHRRITHLRRLNKNKIVNP